MGCIWGKPSAIEDIRETPRERQLNKGSSDLHVPQVIFSKRHDSFRVKERLDGGHYDVGYLNLNGSKKMSADYVEKIKRKDSEIVGPDYPAIVSIPKATEGEQVAAGWPSWLATVSGEAISGWVPRRANTFEKLDKIGHGTYSTVYKARDLIHMKIVALKRVRFDNTDPESVKFMAREILILRRLDHPNTIKLEAVVTSQTSCILYLVFEYMEHDLTGLASLPGAKFSEPQIKCYMQQLLSGLDHCHSRGVLHRDIKGSNLLIDNHGILKIADFGLASFFDHHHNVPLTSRVVTLWYRPPELLLGATHYGVSVDLWSTGCILGELYAGNPIMPGRTEVEQLHKIFKLCGSPSDDYWRKSKLPHSTAFKPLQPYERRLAETFKDFPPAAIGLMETLLSVDPENRGTTASALKDEYFTTPPLACDPLSLPKYPPSKEIDTKLRQEAAKRKEVSGGRGQRFNQESGGTSLPRAIPVPNANAELVISMQTRRRSNSTTKSRREMLNSYQEEAASGGPPRQTQAAKGGGGVDKDATDQNRRRASHSGPVDAGIVWKNKYNDISIGSTRADLSTLSSLVASRRLSEVPSQQASVQKSGKNDRIYQTQSITGSQRVEKGRSSFRDPVLVLKEHQRRIQEAARQSRLEKPRLGKRQASGMEVVANPIYIPGRGAV